jgi:hypothetical protein
MEYGSWGNIRYGMNTSIGLIYTGMIHINIGIMPAMFVGDQWVDQKE